MYSQVDLTLIEVLTRYISPEIQPLNPGVAAPKCEIQVELPSRVVGPLYAFTAGPRSEPDEVPLRKRLLYRILYTFYRQVLLSPNLDSIFIAFGTPLFRA